MSKNTFDFSCHDLPRRAGEMREYELTFDQHEPVGIALVAIPTDAPIDVDLRLQSVAEGVLASAEVRAEAVGECIRCLEPVSFDIDESFQELYNYELDTRHKSKSREKEIDVQDEDAELWMEGDFINLEGPIRDAVILNLPINPLCSPDCQGLCPDCGLKWIDLPEGHAHAGGDIRWAGLEGWKSPNS